MVNSLRVGRPSAASWATTLTATAAAIGAALVKIGIADGGDLIPFALGLLARSMVSEQKPQEPTK